MNPELRATLIRIQQQVVGHYAWLLTRSMSDREQSAIREKLARDESVLSELLTDRRAAA